MPSESRYIERYIESDADKRDRLINDIIDRGDSSMVAELLPLLPVDDGDRGIEIISDVRAYWQGSIFPSLSNSVGDLTCLVHNA